MTSRSLQSVHRAVVSCRLCPRLVGHRQRIAREKKREFWDWTYWGRPVPGFGDPDARLVIVGLAPAAHGANRTGRMFTGDSSGDWLYEALHRYGFANQAESTSRDDGLRLADCFVTAAARCAPPGNRPTPAELDNCNPYLQAELRLLWRRRVVLALGHVAHRQWMKASGWKRLKFAHAATYQLPDDTTLICSYHPSRQNTNTGRLTRAMWYEIFERARGIVDGR